MPKASKTAFADLAYKVLTDEFAKDNVVLTTANEKINKVVNPYKDLEKYQKYPIAFFKNILNIDLTPDQKKALVLLNRPPYNLFISASHSVGKSFLASGVLLWFFFCHENSISLVTAPTNRQVNQVIMATARSLNTIDSSVFRGDFSNRMYINPSWFGLGLSSSTGDGVQGLHASSAHQLMLMDEAVGLKQGVLDGLLSMNAAEAKVLAICNPTDITSPIYKEQLHGNWHRLRISALNHPNIHAELAGKEPPFPAAIRLSYLQDLFTKWTTSVGRKDVKKTDIEWPPGSGKYYRPNELFVTRVLGNWFTGTTDSVFSLASLEVAFDNEMEIDESAEIAIGVDVARGGKDYSVISSRIGSVLLSVEKFNTQDLTILTEAIVERLEELSERFHVSTRDIVIKVDETGVGGGVVDILFNDNYNVFGINFGNRSQLVEHYPDMRSELWFTLSDRVKDEEIDMSRVLYDIKDTIRSEALGTLFSYDQKGRRKLEPKDATRKRTGFSPDTIDSIALCFIKVLPGISVSVLDQ